MLSEFMQTFKMNSKMGFPQPVHYTEGGIDISAKSFPTLCRKLYKLRNQWGGDLKPGWQDRFATELCNKELHAGCLESDITVRRVKLDELFQFFEAMKRWKRTGGKIVPPAVSEGRAAVCVACEENVPLVGCFGCANVLPTILEMIKGASTSHDASLNGCGVCGCALKAKIHLPIEVMANSLEEMEQFPENCFIRKEFEASK
jgi:hypothetical protein